MSAKDIVLNPLVDTFEYSRAFQFEEIEKMITTYKRIRDRRYDLVTEVILQKLLLRILGYFINRDIRGWNECYKNSMTIEQLDVSTKWLVDYSGPCYKPEVVPERIERFVTHINRFENHDPYLLCDLCSTGIDCAADQVDGNEDETLHVTRIGNIIRIFNKIRTIQWYDHAADQDRFEAYHARVSGSISIKIRCRITEMVADWLIADLN